VPSLSGASSVSLLFWAMLDVQTIGVRAIWTILNVSGWNSLGQQINRLLLRKFVLLFSFFAGFSVYNECTCFSSRLLAVEGR